MVEMWRSVPSENEIREYCFQSFDKSLQDSGEFVFNDDETFVLQILKKKVAVKLEGKEELINSTYNNVCDAFKTMMITLRGRHPWVRSHMERVTKLAVNTACQLGLSKEDIRTLQLGGYIHDIGKVGISYTIITKPGKLSDEEFDIIKTHPVVGEVIARGLGMSQEEVSMIKYHHERWDGSGYPEGLSGEDIPYLARILAVADSYDAMTSHRPYKDVLSPIKAEYELRDQSGWQFDGDIVAAFITGGIESYLQGERFVEIRF